LWGLVLKSGVHATLAGVVLALTIPMKVGAGARAHSPLLTAEHRFAPWTTFLIVPLFGFANAGVSFAGMSASTLTQAVPLGVALGLFLGKQAGVFLTVYAVIRTGYAALPAGATWRQMYGIAALCGIGFTMSLFIGLLAFPDDANLQEQLKLGVLLGSISSAAVGVLMLRGAKTSARSLSKASPV